jgi:capsular exopolysaccharide synthesis family protein
MMSQDVPALEQPQQTQENQFRFIINVLMRRWRMIGAFTVVTMLLTGFLGMYRKEEARATFRARAEVLVKQSAWEKEILQGVGGASLTPLTPKALISRTSKENLAEAVVRALVQRDIAEGGPWSELTTEDEINLRKVEVANRIALEPDAESGLVRIDVSNCPTQEEAIDIAEFAARVFVETNREFKLEDERETHDMVKNRLEELQNELYKAETAEWEFKRQMGFRTYGEVGEEMASNYDELEQLEATKEKTKARLAEIEAELTVNTTQLPEALGNMTDTVVNELLTELDQLLKKKLEMSAAYLPTPEGQQVLEQVVQDDDIAEKKDQVLEAVRMLDAGFGGGSSIWQKRQTLYREQLELRLQLTSDEIRAAALQKVLENMIPRIPELANKNLEYERLAQETQHIRTQFNKLREREFEIRTVLSRSSGQVERRSAVVPLPFGPTGQQIRTWLNFVIGAGLGFLVSFCLALMWEMMDTSIRSIEDVTEHIGLEVMGTIPRMRFGRPRGSRKKRGTYVTSVDEEQIDACIVTQHDPKSPISEAYRTLRTNFQFATLQSKPRTVMVTSAVPGEGKTTTAVNMAVTISDRGMRVLLVDTDLRRPNVHRVLKMERGPGLADILREGIDPARVIRPTRVQNLWIVSSGRVPPNPSELIGSERMGQVIRHLGASFDLVVCDAPSILVVTDPVLLSTHVDTVVLVVSANNARRETIQRACKLLQTANAHIAGVVLNGLEVTRRHYYYYYYYYDDASRGVRRWYHF